MRGSWTAYKRPINDFKHAMRALLVLSSRKNQTGRGPATALGATSGGRGEGWVMSDRQTADDGRRAAALLDSALPALPIPAEQD